MEYAGNFLRIKCYIFIFGTQESRKIRYHIYEEKCFKIAMESTLIQGVY